MHVHPCLTTTPSSPLPPRCRRCVPILLRANPHLQPTDTVTTHLQPTCSPVTTPFPIDSVHAVHPTSRLRDKIQTPHIPQIIRLHIAIRRRGKATSLPRGSPASLPRPGPGLTAFSSTFPRAERHRQRTDSAKITSQTTRPRQPGRFQNPWCPNARRLRVLSEADHSPIIPISCCPRGKGWRYWKQVKKLGRAPDTRS